jgi:hypothetical protein
VEADLAGIEVLISARDAEEWNEVWIFVQSVCHNKHDRCVQKKEHENKASSLHSCSGE